MGGGTNAAGTNGASAAVCGEHGEKTCRVKAVCDASIAVLLRDVNGLAEDPGGGGGESGEQRGGIGFEAGELEIERAEQGDEERGAADGMAGGELERGGERSEAGGERGVADVEADTDDGVAEGVGRGGVNGGFYEDAAELFRAEEEVVGPADVGCESGGLGDGGLRGEAGGKRKPKRAGERELRADESGDVNAVAGGGVPGVAGAAAAGGLLVGDEDGVFGEGGGLCEERGVGGGDGGEVVEAAGKTGGGERGVGAGDVNLCGGQHAVMLSRSILYDMPTELNVGLGHQFAMLLMLALPIACASWTVTHEEVFREPREFCKKKSEECGKLAQRKFFYLFTCEYCFSHYVTLVALWVFRYRLLFAGWRGYVAAWFALVWVANVYMSFFNRLRLEIKHENVSIAVEQGEK